MVVEFRQEISVPEAPAAPLPMLAETEPAPAPAAESLEAPAIEELFDPFFGIDPEMTVVETEVLPPTPVPALQAEPQEARLETAVRLTGQAFQAWLSLIQTPSVAFESDSTTFSR